MHCNVCHVYPIFGEHNTKKIWFPNGVVAGEYLTTARLVLFRAQSEVTLPILAKTTVLFTNGTV
jgi:hypothetical protein